MAQVAVPLIFSLMTSQALHAANEIMYGSKNKSDAALPPDQPLADFGAPISKIFGGGRVGGNLIYCSAPYAVPYTNPPHDRWVCDVAIAIGQGIIDHIHSIYVNDVKTFGENFEHIGDNWSGDFAFCRAIQFFTGTETQEAPYDLVWRRTTDYNNGHYPELGDGTYMPAYRGLAYVVLYGVEIYRFGGNVPQLSFVVGPAAEGSTAPRQFQFATPSPGPDGLHSNIVDHPEGVIYVGYAGGKWFSYDSLHNSILVENNANYSGGAEVTPANGSAFDIDASGRILTFRRKAGTAELEPVACYPTSFNFVLLPIGMTFPAGRVIDVVRALRCPTLPFWMAVPKHTWGVDNNDVRIIGSGGYQSLSWSNLWTIKDITSDDVLGVFYLLSKHHSYTTNLLLHVVECTGGVWTATQIGAIVTDTACDEMAIRWTNPTALSRLAVGVRNSVSGWSKIYMFSVDLLNHTTTLVTSAASMDASNPLFATGDFRPSWHSRTNNSLWDDWDISYVAHGNELWTLNTAALTTHQNGTASPFTGLFSGACLHTQDGKIISAVASWAYEWAWMPVYTNPATGSIPTVTDIIEWTAEQVGLTTADMDTSQLVGLSVWGLALGSRGTALSAIQPLLDFFFIDVVEEDGLICFRPKGLASVAAYLTEDDLAAQDGSDGEPEDKITCEVEDDLELPLSVEISYLDYEADYQQAAESAHRSGYATSSTQLYSVDARIAANSDMVRNAAETMLCLAWTQRLKYAFKVSDEFMLLSPTDVVLLTRDSGEILRLRLMSTTMADGIIEVSAVPDNPLDLVQGVLVNQGKTRSEIDERTPSNAVTNASILGGLSLVVCDPPLLREEHDIPRVIVGVSRMSNPSGMASVFTTDDAGATWRKVGSVFTDATTGFAQSVLPDCADVNAIDESAFVDVMLTNMDGTLSSVTLEDLAGTEANLCMVGDELIQFRDAEEFGSGLYRLTGLVRGRKGTEWATGTHAVMEPFIFLSSGTLLQVPVDVSARNQTSHFAVSSQSSNSGPSVVASLPIALRSLMPLAGVFPIVSVDGSGDATISWTRRSRIGGAWADSVDVPIGEADERYEIDVATAGGVIVRTILVTTPAASYTTVQRATDGFSEGDAVEFRIYQMSNLVGRGYPLVTTKVLGIGVNMRPEPEPETAEGRATPVGRRRRIRR